jgi:hypothetical protein
MIDAFKAALNITHEPSRQRDHIQAAADIQKTYTASVQAETSELRFTEDGLRRLKRKYGLPALTKLAELLTKVSMTLNAEVRVATETAVRAMDAFAPPYSREPWNAAFDLELAKLLRANPSVVAMMAGAGEAGAQIPADHADHARTALRAPRALTGVTAEQHNDIIAYLTDGDLSRKAFESAADAKMMIRNVVTKICAELEMRLPELAGLHRGLAELLARGSGELGTPQPDAPLAEDYAAVSSVTPLVSGDEVDAGHSPEAVA